MRKKDRDKHEYYMNAETCRNRLFNLLDRDKLESGGMEYGITEDIEDDEQRD